MMPSTLEKTDTLLAALWLRNRPLLEQRMVTLERACAAAADGSLREDQREEAADVAHKLAGSLGMYGYDQGTRIARQLELLLDYAAPDAARLRALTVELRSAITA